MKFLHVVIQAEVSYVNIYQEFLQYGKQLRPKQL